MTAPALPKDKSLAQLKEILKSHFEPTTIVIAERYYFHRRNQAEDEGIADYVAELRRLSVKCDFGDYLEQALWDKLVCGLRNRAIPEELLTKRDLTLQRAQEIAEGMEAASKNTQQLNPKAPSSLNMVRGGGLSCYRCGRNNHLADQCRFKDSTCGICRTKGHLAQVCLFK